MKEDRFYAVIDTNVLVSAIISKHLDSNPVKVFRAIIENKIIPLFNQDILSEYREVLSRPKFNLEKGLIDTVLQMLESVGLNLERTSSSGEYFPDTKDIVFYEVSLSMSQSFLVTGNLKHFPAKPFIITPAEMVTLLEQQIGLLS